MFDSLGAYFIEWDAWEFPVPRNLVERVFYPVVLSAPADDLPTKQRKIRVAIQVLEEQDSVCQFPGSHSQQTCEKADYIRGLLELPGYQFDWNLTKVEFSFQSLEQIGSAWNLGPGCFDPG